VSRIGVAKVDRDAANINRDVAHVAMATHVCFKCMFQLFQLYQTYVPSIFIRML
jgi:S-adenosylmethionine synthetase